MLLNSEIHQRELRGRAKAGVTETRRKPAPRGRGTEQALQAAGGACRGEGRGAGAGGGGGEAGFPGAPGRTGGRRPAGAGAA